MHTVPLVLSFISCSLIYSQAHPGTLVKVIDLYDKLVSLVPLWIQVQGFRKDIESIIQQTPEGIHLLCFSQGLGNFGEPTVDYNFTHYHLLKNLG